MPEVFVSGSRVFYLEQGNGEAIVLLHAGGLSSRQWVKVASVLEREFRVVAPDLWGFGGTDRWKGEKLSHDDHANLVADLVQRLGLGKAHVLGHSYGGASAVRLALSRPELLKSLILIEPILTPLLESVAETALFSEYRQMAQAFVQRASAGNVDGAWEAFIDYRNGAGAWSKLPPASRQRLIQETAGTVAGFHANLGNPTSLEDLRQLRVPTLVLCGEKTTAVDRRVAQIVYEHIPGCRYAVLPGADHMSPLSHPILIAEAVRAHVRGSNPFGATSG